jgi:hypothetical protein
MTEYFGPCPVHGGQGSGSSNEGRLVPRRALLSFQRPLSAGLAGLATSSRASSAQKGPLVEGPGNAGRDLGQSGPSLRGVLLS